MERGTQLAIWHQPKWIIDDKRVYEDTTHLLSPAKRQ